MAKLHRDEDGTLPTYAWPGGYPVYYLCADGGCLCAACANRENGSEASEDPAASPDWRLVAQDINWEDTTLECEHCGKRIDPAYLD